MKCATFKAFEYLTSRSFPSKVFLFEKCLLYTKIVDGNLLGYRDHFRFISGISLNLESQVSFRISSGSKKDEVVFSSGNIESISEMKKLISRFYDPRRSADSAFVDGNELMIIEDQDMSQIDDEEWVVAEHSPPKTTNGTPCDND